MREAELRAIREAELRAMREAELRALREAELRAMRDWMHDPGRARGSGPSDVGFGVVLREVPLVGENCVGEIVVVAQWLGVAIAR